MGEREPAGVWPRWVRWSVLGLLAGVLVVGVVLTVTGGGVDAAVVRIVVAGVVVPCLLAPVRLLAARRRRPTPPPATPSPATPRPAPPAPHTGTTRDGRAFRVEQRWKEQVVYWEDGHGFLFDAGWGATPPVLYVPSARLWDDVVPDWLRGRRAAVVEALRE